MKTLKFEYGFQGENGIEKKIYTAKDILTIEHINKSMPLIYIRQFTTFKTKAGTELYQDDIIQLSNNEGKTFIGNINWSDRRGCYEVIARYKSKEYNRLWLDQVTAHNAIHLGNIYENLDLLRN